MASWRHATAATGAFGGVPYGGGEGTERVRGAPTWRGGGGVKEDDARASTAPLS